LKKLNLEVSLILANNNLEEMLTVLDEREPRNSDGFAYLGNKALIGTCGLLQHATRLFE
jgi:hypothetical protein